MTASNTHDCFREFLGQQLTGLLFGALPSNRRDLSEGTKTLIFEDGRGLTIASNGSYWIDSAKAVQWAIEGQRREIAVAQRELSAQLDAIPEAG